MCDTGLPGTPAQNPDEMYKGNLLRCSKCGWEIWSRSIHDCCGIPMIAIGGIVDSKSILI